MALSPAAVEAFRVKEAEAFRQTFDMERYLTRYASIVLEKLVAKENPVYLQVEAFKYMSSAEVLELARPCLVKLGMPQGSFRLGVFGKECLAIYMDYTKYFESDPEN